MTTVHTSEFVSVWTEQGRSVRLVWRGDRFLVTDTPTPLREPLDHHALTHSPQRIVGWQFQGTSLSRWRYLSVRRTRGRGYPLGTNRRLQVIQESAQVIQKRYEFARPDLAAEGEARDRRAEPVSLPDALVRHTGRRQDEPRPVRFRAIVPVRVAYSDVFEVDTEVIASTPGGAVLIRFTPAGERFEEYIWGWSNAVRRIGYPQD